MKRNYLILFLSCFAFISCTRQRKSQPEESSPGHGPKYAIGFSIDEYRGFRVLHVTDPWQGSSGVHFRYVLADKGTGLPDSLSGLPLVRTPVSRIICMSTTHIAMVGALGKNESIVGVSGREYVSQPLMRDRLEKGLVKDVGADQNLNYELIVSLKPDAIIAYGITGEISGMIDRLEELGIPVILDGDYLENDPLGKLEWIRFMAALYGKDEMADSIFSRTEAQYLELREKAGKPGNRPAVMTGLPWKGSWYIPGGGSFMAAFIRDAGGDFLWEDAPNLEALPFSLETVYAKASSADIWINCGSARSLSDIESTDDRLARFEPWINGNVYNNTARINPEGGNDFWESGVMNPHIILADMIKIFHPEVLPDHELVYYKKLE